MADIVVKAVEIGLPYVVSGVKAQYRYLFRFGAFRDKLKKEVEKLKGVEENVISRVEADRNDGRTIFPTVDKWLVDVSAILVEADTLNEEMQNKEGCFMGRTCWYPLSKKFEKKTVQIIELREDEKSFKEVSLPRAHLPIPYVSSDGFVFSSSSKAALDEIMEGLKDERTKVIGLYGMGGVGKTTLAEQVIQSVKDSELFDKVSMVAVSETQDLMAVQDKVAAVLGLKFEDENDVRTKAGPLSLRLGKEKKVLIILDDIWDEIDLPKIGMTFTADQKGCKILITTRFHLVCSQMNCNKRIHIDLMCETEAWDLFKKKAALDDASPIIDIAKEVAKECGGLPIAIVPLARALVNNTPNQWKHALQCLRNSNLPGINNIDDQNAYKCMKLSYDKLNGEEVKFCFLMCSLFPEDHEIQPEFLVRYAWGLGICKDADTIEEGRIKIQSCIDHLKDYCLLINGDRNRVKMHDVVRHFALWIAFNVEKDFTVGYISKKGVIRKSLESYRAISLIIKDAEDLPSGLLCGKLKLLLLHGEGRMSRYCEGGMSVSDTFFKQMEALQVLAPSNCSFTPYLGNISISLRVLTLERCKVQGDISSIGNLVKLEILSFAGSDIRELPDEIGEMKDLKVLDLSDCDDLERIPAGLIQKLLCLEELYVTCSERTPWEVRGVDSGSSGKARLSEINSLSKLSVLYLDNIGECLLPDCFSLPKLTRYHFIEPHVPYSYGVDNIPTSKIVNMNKFNETSLNAFKRFFSTAEQLVMGENEEIRCIVPEMELGVFNNLIYLELSNWKKMVCLIDTTVENVPTMAFGNLKVLHMSEMNSLKELCGGRMCNKFLQKLERVRITECPKLCSIFKVHEEEIGNEDNLMLFSTLKYLTLRDLPELSCVWDGPTQHINLNRLTRVTIERCSKLKSFFKVQEEEIGKEDNLMLFSTLLNLSLEDLPELSCVWEGPTQHINLNRLTIVRIDKCRKLKSIFSLSMARTLVHLNEILIKDCDELEHIIKEEEENGLEPSTSMSHLIFTELLQVSICGCNKLKYVSPIFLAPSFLQQLKSIYLYGNGALEQIFKYAEGNHMEIELSHLEHIYIKGSPKLVNFSGGHCSSLSFPSLQNLNIKDCAIQFPGRIEAKQLKKVLLQEVPKEWGNYILSLLNIGDLPNLNFLAIGSLIGVEEVIRLEVDNHISDLVLPIQTLLLTDLPQLEHICTCPSYTGILQNLKILEIFSCHKLSYILSPTLAQNLPMLEKLIVAYCKELVHVIGNDNEGVPNTLKLEGFPSLKEIMIKKCNKIKFVFPLSLIAGGLPNLEELRIEECDGVEYVFGNETLEARKNSIEKEEVVLPKLKNIVLKELPSLIGLSVAGYNIICPRIMSETDFQMTDCPNFTESFTLSATHGTTIAKENASFEYDDSKQETVSVIRSGGESVDDIDLMSGVVDL